MAVMGHQFEHRQASTVRDGVMRVTALVVVGMAIAGCLQAPLTRGSWVKPGTEREHQLRDQYECERHAVLARRPGVAPEALYEQCMRARGYERAN